MGQWRAAAGEPGPSLCQLAEDILDSDPTGHKAFLRFSNELIAFVFRKDYIKRSFDGLHPGFCAQNLLCAPNLSGVELEVLVGNALLRVRIVCPEKHSSMR